MRTSRGQYTTAYLTVQYQKGDTLHIWMYNRVVHSEVGDPKGPLAVELLTLRLGVNQSQELLAKRAEVSRNTISDIERGRVVSEAPTLRKLANGLATYAPDRRDDQLAADYHQRLMRAAGHLEEALAVSPGAGDWRHGYQQHLAEYFGEDVDVVDRALTQLSRLAQTERRFVLSLIQGGVDHWMDHTPGAKRALSTMQS